MLDRSRAHPVLLAAAVVAGLAALYATPVLEASLRSVPVHLLVGLAEVCAGLLLLRALLPSSSAAPRSWRTAGTAVLVAALALLALALLLRVPTLAGGWFGAIELPGSDPAADQRRAGAVALLALQVLAPVLMIAAWAGPVDRRSAPG